MRNLYSYYLQVTFLVLIVVNHLWEIYLARRQQKVLHQNRTEVPREFSGHLSVEEHQKAIQYATAKLNLGQLKLLFDAAVLIYWFPLRGIEKLYINFPLHGSMMKEITFLVAFVLIQTLLSLPWSVYSTFVLEEKFGFNKTTPKLYILDRLKGLALAGALGIPLLWLLLYLFQGLGSWWWLASFLALTAFQFFLLWIYPTFIAPLFNKFFPLESQELKDGISRLVQNAGFNAKEVFVMDASKRSSHGNAYFTGLGKNKRVVFFDTLLKHLSSSEIFAILAHELGHMKLKHIPKSMVTSILLSFFGFWLMGTLATENWFYSGHYVRIYSPAILFLLFSEAIPLYTFWVTPVGSWISRKREFEADAYAVKETKAEDLVTGLLKLYKHNASPVVTDSVYSTFYHSHPPALERIKRLRGSLEGKSR